MKLTVYRQALKNRPDGTIVYKGEDGRPYVDEKVFFVADGLGGAASIRHQKFTPDLFEEDKLMDALFEGIYEDYRNETFVKYVTDSFYELFAVKHCYNDNINNLKKSGFFASRIVTAIILHEMLYNEEYDPEKLFLRISACESDDARKEETDAIGSYFKNLIQTKIRQIAQKANLIYESSYSNLSLLGSTLCATIYLERENSVEAIYLTAGDSRPYIWTEEKGLCQLLEDQEGADGGMTNYIRANEDSDFNIRCDHFSFAKPCVLLNVSDGCFDSDKFFISQLGFEKLLLESGAEAGSIEKMSDILTEFFVSFGRHDDSSTIAMITFGYDSFESLKASFDKRFGVLNEEYFSVMPDLLEVNYAELSEECDKTLPIKLDSLKESFSATKGVADYCAEYIRSGKFAPYNEGIRVIKETISSEKQKISRGINEISEIVASNYIKFKCLVESEDGFREQLLLSKIEGLENKQRQAFDDYISRIQRYRVELDETVHTLTEILESVYSVGIPTSFDDYDRTALELVEKCEESMDELFDFFNGVRSRRLDVLKRLTQQRNEYVEKNKKLAANNSKNLLNICAMIVNGQIDISEIDLLASEKTHISEELDRIETAKGNVLRLQGEETERVFKEACESLWKEKYVDIILAVISDPKYEIEQSLIDEAKLIIEDFCEKTKDVREKSEIQKTLVDKYETSYRMYIGGIADGN